jgi:inhibitor of cysteine peptidase
VASLLVAAALASRAGAAPAASGRTVGVDARDNHGQVQLRVGDTLVVSLQANPSTGYRWQITENNPSILRSLGAPTFVPDRGELIGGRGRQVFRFQAVGNGGTGLTMLYQRTGRRDPRPGDRFEILILVRGTGPRETVTVTDGQNHGTVTLRQGDILQVRLISNPSTGFAWRIAQNDRGVLQPVGDPRFVRAGNVMPGVSGHQVFRFRAEGPGRFFLRLRYSRPSQPTGVSPRSWEILVTVRR